MRGVALVYLSTTNPYDLRKICDLSEVSSNDSRFVRIFVIYVASLIDVQTVFDIFWPVFDG